MLVSKFSRSHQFYVLKLEKLGYFTLEKQCFEPHLIILRQVLGINLNVNNV